MKRDEQWKQLAANQRGLITRAQAQELGLSTCAIRRRVRSRVLERVLPGVYRVLGSRIDHAQRLMAAVLYAGKGAAVSGPAAAALLDFPRLAEEKVQVSSPRNLRHVQGVSVRRTRLGPSEVTRRGGGLPVTTELRTLLDLAATASVEDLRSVVDHLLRSKRFSAEGLARAVALRRTPGVEKLREILAGYETLGPPTESELEARVRDRIEEWGFPRPVLQHVEKAGKKVRRGDFAWPRHKTWLEVDGHRWHSDPLAFERDRQRHNDLTVRGWRMLHVTWRALEDEPERLYWQLHGLLPQREAC